MPAVCWLVSMWVTARKSSTLPDFAGSEYWLGASAFTINLDYLVVPVSVWVPHALLHLDRDPPIT